MLPEPEFTPGVVQIQPTPERGWMWRRLYAFLATAVLLVVLGLIVWRLDNAEALRAIAYGVMGLLGLLQLFYLGGATLTDLWRLVSAVRTTRIVNEHRRVARGSAE